MTMAWAFNMLGLEECVEVAKPGQAGVVERRGAQGAVGEGCEGDSERYVSQPDAGYRAARAV